MDQLQDTIIKEPLRWLDIKVINPSDFTELLVRFGFKPFGYLYSS